MATNEEKPSENPLAPEENEEAASMSTWFSGWYDTAKKKLAETNEFMKHDLQEFSQAVQTDASRIVAATATTMKEKLNINVDLEEASAATRVVKDSLSNFLGNIANKVGPIRPDDDENLGESAIIGTGSGTKVLSPSEARIYAIRTDPATFCNEPDNENEYHSWSPNFNLEDKKTEISSLMLDCSQIRSLYTKLVPTAVSHCDFWARYYFKLHQHEKAEERRALLVERAQKTHDDIEWDDEDDWIQPKSGAVESSLEPVAIPTEKSETEDDQLKKRLEIPPELIKNESSEIKNSLAKESQSIESIITSKSGDMIAHESETKDFETVPQPSADNGNDKLNDRDSTATEQISEDLSIEKFASSAKKTDPKEINVAHDDKTLDSKSKDTTSDETAKPTETGKVPSSGESSDDWEKDFDLDMTEDEIQQALKESDTIDVGDIGEDWENWE
uniref:BSD domain-containing protein 1-like n=1 Tax=Styela clava TaxID=7725 RepID=UPI00193A3616|nr:BSD domain-containing protein 1-like [Styela clava]